jgi:hypothetical protein
MLEEIVRIHSSEVSVTRIPKGRWVLEYGLKFPSVLNSGLPFPASGCEIDSGVWQGVLDSPPIVHKEMAWSRISV